MNKNELINNVAQETGLSKADASRAVDAFVEITKRALSRKDDVTLVGFGTFTTSRRSARTGRNPQTGATIQIPATVVPKFKAGKTLKNAVK